MLKVGLVGYGYWGPNLARNLKATANAQLTIICDLKDAIIAEVQKKHPDIKTTKEYTQLLTAVDAVIIATPPATHYPLAKRALQEGKHVFVEKPLALTKEHAKDLIEEAKRAGVVLMVGHTYEYVPQVNKLKEIISSGEIGKVHYLYTQRLNLGLWQPDCNVVWDLAPHDVSIILYIIGEMPVTVNAVGSAHVQAEKEDVAFITLNFKGGKTAHIQLSWLDPVKTRKVVIVGDKKMVVYDDIAPKSITLYEKKVRQQKYETFNEFHIGRLSSKP